MGKSTSKKNRILIPGDFEKDYFSEEQVKYIQLLADICNASLLFVHIGNPDSLPNNTYNQNSFLQSYNELSQKVDLNLYVLCKQMKKEGTEAEYMLLGEGNFKNQISEQLELHEPNFILLKKHPKSFIFRNFSKKVPLLFIPEKVSCKLPGRVGLITTCTDTFSGNEMEFFFTLARSSTGQLSFIRIQEDAQLGDNDAGIRKELKEVNLAHGINLELIDVQGSLTPENLDKIIQLNKIDLLFVNCNKKKRLKNLLQRPSLKQLIRKVEQPFFYMAS